MTGLAVITGASSGIGAEYARQLAMRGYALLLVARREQRLQALANQLHTKYGVSAEIHTADLSSAEQTNTLADRLASTSNLTMLVNNAGFGTVGYLHETDTQAQLDMLHLHVNATYLLTRAALQPMVANKRGAIINVSSIAGYFFAPDNVNYCATKAYITSFSESLAMEVEPHGVTIQALCPGYTRSEFHGTDKMIGFNKEAVSKHVWQSAETVVTLSLEALEKPKSSAVFIPGTHNRALVASRRTMPIRLIKGVVKRMAGR